MQQEKSPWLRLVHYLRPYWPGYVAGGFYLTLVEGTGQLLAAYFLKMLIDASVAADVPVLVHNLILFGLAFLVLSALLPFAIRLHARAVENATADLRQDVFDHMQTLPLAYHEQQHSGDTVSRLTTDVAQTKEAMGDTLLTFLMLSFEAIVAMVFIAIIDWRFVVIAITVGLLPLLFNRYAGRAVRQLSRQVQGSLASLNAHLKDMLVGMPVVKAYGLEQRFVADYAVANTTLREQGSTLARKQAGVVVGNDMLASATFMSVIAFGSYLILQGELTAGEAVAAVQLCNGIANPMRRLGDLWVTMQRSLGAADRVFAVLDMPSEQLTRNGTASADDLSMVSLQSVSFAYDENPVLSDISLSVAPGSVVALAGPSGGGKSTIFKLLLGFYQANAGECYIAGRSLADYELAELRDLIAFVPQDSYLYAGTVYENIAYGNPAASAEEIYAAARLANAHGFIMELPHGYDTQVGERGAQLSGGQRQRVAIARALLKDAPILLLDEATSSLDSEAEQLVQEALYRLMQGRTTLVIAHRLSTIEAADCIHVVDAGRIVESGTHQDLLQQDGVYRQLYDLQLQG